MPILRSARCTVGSVSADTVLGDIECVWICTESCLPLSGTVATLSDPMNTGVTVLQPFFDPINTGVTVLRSVRSFVMRSRTLVG